MKIELIPYDCSCEAQAQEIYDIILKYFPKSPWPPEKKTIREGRIKYFKAVVGDEQVGITGYSLKTPTLAETVKTTIFEEHRGKGLGHLLSRAIESECKKMVLKKL